MLDRNKSRHLFHIYNINSTLIMKLIMIGTYTIIMKWERGLHVGHEGQFDKENRRTVIK